MSGMDSINENFIRKIVREELHAYETLLSEWILKREIAGAAHRNVSYEEFIDRVLLNDDTKAKAD
jgi:hypothetical protein